jgi:hypothetical protein
MPNYYQIPYYQPAIIPSFTYITPPFPYTGYFDPDPDLNDRESSVSERIASPTSVPEQINTITQCEIVIPKE